MTETVDEQDAETRRAAVSGDAWNDFCDTLKDAGRLVLENSSDDLARIEGFRYLSRLARGGIQNFVEASERTFPRIQVIPDMLKIGCDNPDALYQRVNVDPAHRYRSGGPEARSTTSVSAPTRAGTEPVTRRRAGRAISRTTNRTRHERSRSSPASTGPSTWTPASSGSR